MKEDCRKIFLGLFMCLLLCVFTVPECVTVFANDSRDEISIWWINDYHGDQTPLTYCDDNAEDFADQATEVGDWYLKRQYGNDNAKENHFECEDVEGDDSSYADIVDVFWFSGHGNYKRITFAEDNDGDGTYKKRVNANAGSSKNEPEWGDTDLEWAMIHACLTLGEDSEEASEWDDAFIGLHGICGFKSEAFDVDGFGYSVGVHLKNGYNFYDAWSISNSVAQPRGTDAAIYCAKIRMDGQTYKYCLVDELDDMYPDYDGDEVIKTGYYYKSWESTGGT